MTYKNIVFMFFILFVLSITSCQSNRIQADQGFIDLSGWDLSEDGEIRLQGEWEFYWEQFYFPRDFEEFNYKPDAYIQVPHRWKNKKFQGEKLDAFGYATYRLTVNLADNTNALGFKMSYQGTAYHLWINGELAAVNGKLGTNRQQTVNQYMPLFFIYTPETNYLELVMHVANFDYGTGGGIWSEPVMGTDSRIQVLSKRRLVIEAFIIGVLIVLFFYHMSLFIVRRKDISTLYFALICISFAVRTLFVREMLPVQILPQFPWEILLKFNYISMFMGMLMIFLFVDSTFYYRKSFVVKRIASITIIIISLWVLLTPVHIFSFGLLFYQMIVAGIGLYTIVILIQSIIDGEREGVIFLIGISAYLITGVMDILYSFRLHQLGYTGQYGLLFLIACQIIVMSSRLSRAYHTAESLSQDLEYKVNERTLELEMERNRLQEKNQQINEELKLAQKIQLQFIPSESPSDHISFYYKPMSEVGGDFFHFVNYADGRIGIFISDVSGHGVPAAFITSIIKSNILQFADVVQSPSELMIHLNGALYAQTGGNFVTAFYAIYNPVTCELKFSNAGHNYPYLISTASIGYLEMQNPGVPLAIFSTKELVSRKMIYESQTIYLPVNSKLLLYTDGLSEAVNKEVNSYSQFTSIPDFEKKRMMDVLDNLQKSTPDELIKGLIKELIEFRGNDEFDDDVCIICLEVM